jgi:hypothetical protein
MKYKITISKKDGQPIDIRSIQIAKNAEVYAIYYKNEKDQLTWCFPEELDEIKLEKI